MVERPISSFGANTEKNPKEECRPVLTRSQRRAQGEKWAKGDQSKEERTDREGEKVEEKKEEENEGEKKVLISKTESQLAREARKEEPPAPLKELSYPLVPLKKNKERYFKRFLQVKRG